MVRPRTNLVIAVVATLFGVLTVVAGSRVLLGADPGYVVYRPLLQFNTVMGFAYVGVGLLAWQGHKAALFGAAAITGLNLLVLLLVAYGFATGAAVAATSLGAMSFRTVVWSVLLFFLVRQHARSSLAT